MDKSISLPQPAKFFQDLHQRFLKIDNRAAPATGAENLRTVSEHPKIGTDAKDWNQYTGKGGLYAVLGSFRDFRRWELIGMFVVHLTAYS